MESEREESQECAERDEPTRQRTVCATEQKDEVQVDDIESRAGSQCYGAVPSEDDKGVATNVPSLSSRRAARREKGGGRKAARSSERRVPSASWSLAYFGQILFNFRRKKTGLQWGIKPSLTRRLLSLFCYIYWVIFLECQHGPLLLHAGLAKWSTAID